MKTPLKSTLILTLAALSALALPASAVDLLARYPTQLTAGETRADQAKPWTFTQDDIFRVSDFQVQVGDKLKIEVHAADLGIGHCADGAVWAVLLPREDATLTSPAAAQGEPIATIWLRFHPGQLNRLFPADTVSAGDASVIGQIRKVVGAKFNSSWHAGMNAMIPEPKDVTVDVDTKAGARRFYIVDTSAKTAEYVAAFNRSAAAPASGAPSIDNFAPVVVKTIPEAGSKDTPPGEFEVKVVFSKEMADQSWSWCTAWENSTPDSIGDIHYEADHKTCALKVKLVAGKTYGWWINTQNHHNFQDSQNHPAIPYLFTFKVKD
jgi:hypothetical protein